MSTWTTPATWVNGAVTAATMNVEMRDHLNFLKGALDLITNSTTADTGTATHLRIVRNGGTDEVFGSRIAAEGSLRFEIRAGGTLLWGPGSASSDINFSRTTTRRLMVGNDATGNPQLGIELLASPGSHNALFVFATGDTQPRISLATNASHKGEIRFGPGSSTVPDLFLSRDDTGRLLFSAGSGHVRVGTLLGDTSTDSNAFFVWASGDSVPRVTIGQDSSGRAKVHLGPGGASALDVRLHREAANVLASEDTALRLYRASSSSGALAIRTAGDSTDRILLFAGGWMDMIEISTPAVPAADAARLYVQDNGAGKTRLVVKFNTGADVVLATQA